MSKKQAIILGAGLGGLIAAIKLQEAGHDITVLEKHPRVGGTWHQNSYPGCACDVPVALYQLSFAQSMNWSRLYPQAPEIQAYAEEITDRYQLRPNLHLGEGAKEAIWDEDAKIWTVTSETGATYTSDVLICALGQLSRPQWPNIKGLDTFEGPMMHSAGWDHSVDFAGKRVGVVGSAASAIQLIPELAKVSEHLTVFQRTPNWVIPRYDRAVQPEEVALMMTQPEAAISIAERNRQLIFEQADHFFWQAFEWTPEGRSAYTRLATDQLNNQVADPELRAKLTPDYPVGCKRILISDDYYPAMCRDNVSLVTEGISEVTPTGVITSSGAAHEFDILVFATGFETTGWRWSVDVVGADGKHLGETWADHPEAYRGVTVAGFPNMFVLYGPNTNLGHNSITFMMERQVEYALQALESLDAAGAKALAPKPAAQSAWNTQLQKDLEKTVWADPHCSSWYKNEKGLITQNWSGNCTAFAASLAEVKLEDYDLA